MTLQAPKKARPYKLIAFDLDGTLLYSIPSLTKSSNDVLAYYGLPPVNEKMVQDFVGNGARRLVERLLEAVPGGSAVDPEEAFRVYKEGFRTSCTYGNTPYKGIPELLKQLKTAGYKLAVLSNKPDEMARLVIDCFFGKELFDYVCGQREGIPLKPEPDALIELLREAGAGVKECLYVGDSEADLQLAQRAGTACAAVLWGYRSEELLRQIGADWYVRSAQELAGILLK